MMEYKRKLFFDFVKEERWLAEMAKRGYAVVSVNSFGRYAFQPCEPKEYNYKIDYRVFPNADDFRDYCSLFEDSGWKHLAGAKSSGTQYFVQMRQEASGDIFSDSASKAGRYKRFSALWLSLLTAFVPIFTALLLTNQYRDVAFTNPKALYFTPGLWEMSGARFWRAFLFETPFALGRGFLWLLILAVLLFYLGSFIKASLLYRRYREESFR